MKLRESIVEIGQPTPLVGVLCETSAGSDTALILLNSGVMHRVGSCRLSVRLARQLAESTGLTCLRFDFSGVGDSCTRRGSGLDFDRAAVAEVVEAMDHLRRIRGIQRFILYGLCSGARVACNVAEQDARVIAVTQLDGFCYPTSKAYLHYYWQRLWSLQAWRKRSARWLGMSSMDANQGSVLTGAKTDFEVPEFAEDPGPEKIAAQLRVLMKRKVKLHCVFTGRDAYYCYQNQFRDCFSQVNFGRHLSLDYFPKASHIFTEPHYQAQMIAGIVRWVQQLKEQTADLRVDEAALSDAELHQALT